MRTLPILVLGLATAAGFAACSSSSNSTNTQSTSDAGATPFDATPPPLESSPPAQIPAGSRHDATSSPIVYDAYRGRLWTANGDIGSISYVDIDSPKVLREIAVGTNVTSVAVSPDSVWVAAVDRGAGTVALITAETQTVQRTIAVGTHPRAAVWDAADPRYLYVTLEDDGAVAVIDRTLGILARTISVGRLPSGVAVSSQRDALYVTHRIDARVTIVNLDDATAPLLDVPLDHEDGDGTLTTPHGTPFAFESLAWQVDGNVAWLPHELFAPTHPFQFQETVFPAVSLVDLQQGHEVETDPNDPNKVIAGRKNLFDAIAVLDETGNVSVMSQPCAAVMHPNGFTGYVVACGSEDVITFDLTAGIATDLLRNLPVDHPIGIALDGTGARAFVLGDQSHSLVTLDTAGGSLVGHVSVLGATLPLVAKDPVDPDMRAGLTNFFRANSSKGTLATTGNNWMSCGACHLDGFVSTNLALFENSLVVDETMDANIGHEGLVDLFSTAPTPTAAAFNPHDILVAFTDQGGIAPDRTGASRANAVDPGAPTADAKTLAAQVARVVARDLPIGPSWLLNNDTTPNTDYDGAWCGTCHATEYAAWQKSAHAHSAVDPMMLFGAKTEQSLRGQQYSRVCAGCHDPVTARTGDTTLTSGRGVTCIGCHDVNRLIRAGGNADVAATSQDWTQEHKAAATAELVKLRDPQFCGGCHQQFTPGGALSAITTLNEWQHSMFAGAPMSGATSTDAGVSKGDDASSGEDATFLEDDAAIDASTAIVDEDAGATVTRCIDCHAQKDSNGVADHLMIGGNAYLATMYGDSDMVSREEANLATAIGLAPTRDGTNVDVVLHNRGAGHAFPTGVTDIREPWVELQAVDANKKVIARYGGPDPVTGLLPANAARLGIDIAKPDGTVLLLHELSEASRITFDRRVPAAGSLTVSIAAPSALPTGATELDAVLFYRNVRTTYYRAATNAATGTSPEVEVARAAVP